MQIYGKNYTFDNVVEYKPDIGFNKMRFKAKMRDR